MSEQHDDRPQERTLAVGEIRVESKNLRASVKENHRGRFLRITEENRGRHSTVIVPAVGIQDFLKLVQQVAAAAPE